MIPPEIRDEIQRRLARAEAEHEVRILWAIESGSRAWGFHSANSDYDVRFIYAHRLEWYLSIDVEHQRDVIEYPIVDEIDLNGWDLRKALSLFAGSNPSFIEWIHSPIIYRQHGDFAEKVRDLIPRVYSPMSGVHHYLSMASNNYRRNHGEPELPLKRYLYMLRPLLCARWIERHESPPPVEFAHVLDLMDDPGLRAIVDEVVATKQHAPELGLTPRIREIDTFVTTELERLGSYRPKTTRAESPDYGQELNQLFRDAIRLSDM